MRQHRQAAYHAQEWGNKYVEVQGGVVGGDGILGRNLDGNFLQVLGVLGLVDDGHENCQTGLQDAVEFPHTLDEPCLLLRNESGLN